MNPLLAKTLVQAGGQILSNVIGKGMDYNYQRKLMYDQQDYAGMMQRMVAAGISPAAAAAGISSSAGNSAPSFSGSGNLADLSSVISSQAQARESETNAKRADIQNEFDKLKMFWQPKLWRTEISESYSRLMKNVSESKYFKQLAGYYEQSKEALQELRPWNLKQAIQTFSNLLASYSEIVSRTKKNIQDTKTSESLEGLYNAETEKTYSEKMNIDQQGFSTMWENQLRSIGINPNQPFYESMKRLAFTNPDSFKEVMDNFTATLNDVDSRLKENLGEHYKRNAAIAGGLLWLQNRHLKNSNLRSSTVRNYAGAVSGFIPFGGDSGSSSSLIPSDIISGQAAIQKARSLGLVLPY